MDELNSALTVIAATVLATGLFSQRIQRKPIQEPLLATLVGVAMGPSGVGILNVFQWGDTLYIIEEGARVTLTVALMGVALRLKTENIKKYWTTGALLATLALLGMWLCATAVLAWVLGLPILIAALIGAAVAPTDPVVASAIVTSPTAKKYLPTRLRSTLSLESGANDGLAYLFVLLPITLHEKHIGLNTWIVEHFLLGVLGALILGTFLGLGAAKLLHWSRRHRMIETYSFLSYTVALSLFTLGISSLLGAESLLSVFVAGLAFDMAADTGEKHEEENTQETMSKLFTLPMFVIFGAALPWEEWMQLGWPLFATAVLIMLLRRIPVLAVLHPLLRRTLSWRDVVFLGWFGPLGIAAVFYAAFAQRQVEEPRIWSIACAVIFMSVMVHGVSAAPFTKLYARNSNG